MGTIFWAALFFCGSFYALPKFPATSSPQNKSVSRQIESIELDRARAAQRVRRRIPENAARGLPPPALSRPWQRQSLDLGVVGCICSIPLASTHDGCRKDVDPLCPAPEENHDLDSVPVAGDRSGWGRVQRLSCRAQGSYGCGFELGHGEDEDVD